MSIQNRLSTQSFQFRLALALPREQYQPYYSPNLSLVHLETMTIGQVLAANIPQLTPMELQPHLDMEPHFPTAPKSYNQAPPATPPAAHALTHVHPTDSVPYRPHPIITLIDTRQTGKNGTFFIACRIACLEHCYRFVPSVSIYAHYICRHAHISTTVIGVVYHLACICRLPP